ncbi:MAG TPA: hypothetical protein VHQ04_08560, partial [Puia sp.]|nr:hypothetical protein [Puia sp.]
GRDVAVWAAAENETISSIRANFNFNMLTKLLIINYQLLTEIIFESALALRLSLSLKRISSQPEFSSIKY